MNLEKHLVGYCDPLTVRAGGEVHFKVSSDTPGSAETAIVELICGDDRPHGTGFEERVLDQAIQAQIDVPQQPLQPGSYGAVADMPAMQSWRLELAMLPTLRTDNTQCVFALPGLALLLGPQGLWIETAAGTTSPPLEVLHSRWHHLTLESSGQLNVRATGNGGSGERQAIEATTELGRPIALHAGAWLFACSAPGANHFNGRLTGPRARWGEATAAHWDFAAEVHRARVDDACGVAPDMALHQTPTRAVRGPSWDGSTQRYTDAPAQYDAIHFHEDDLTDAGWQTTVSWPVPADLKSGQYALRLRQGASEDHIPFFVRPAPGNRGSDVAYLVPTASYLAYANQRVGFSGGIFGSPKLHHANDAWLYEHEDAGYSLYEYHRDQSGVHFSSRLRPVLNMKPRTGTWAFNADTHITAWLHHIDQPFDIVTDEDLHLEGAEALDGYRVVLTGSHPEYYSTAMLDGLNEWLDDGGRLMYLGGNGFYWRIAYDPDNPAIIEVRRAEDGTRAWIAQPGEYYHQFTGEYGGLWRRLGRPPNKTVGIGFAAQGFDGGTHYRMQAGALDPRASFIVDGLSEGELFGRYGVQGGGAAGEEIDRWDDRLGSPRHAIVIASSEDHRPGMLRVKEEYHMMEPPKPDDREVRADMVFFETPGGGAVFSTGSISYTGSLCHNDYDNDIERITRNVLHRFRDAEPFSYPV